MYVDAFWFGVMCTVFVEVLSLMAVAIYLGGKD